MNTYRVSYHSPLGEQSIEVMASNIHTAVKKVLFPMRLGRTPVGIRKGQVMTIRVERIS